MQTVLLNNCSTADTFVLSGWAKANSVPEEPNTDRLFQLRIRLTYTDNSTEVQTADFNTDVRGEWQYTSATIVPNKAKSGLKSVVVAVAYSLNANEAYFDDISLTRESVQTYEYDDNGNVTAVNQTNNSELSYTYSGADLISANTGGKRGI